MKTCLYCGGNNADTATICMICGRDLHTGDHVSRGNGLMTAEERRVAARLALPRPESIYASLLLLVPILVLFLMGLAFIFEPSMDYFYDLKLPEARNVGLTGGGLILASLVALFWMIARTTQSCRAHTGYQMILREESGDENPIIGAYHNYRARVTRMTCLLWLAPIAIFVGFIFMMLMGSVAYYLNIGVVSIPLPTVEDPIPYVCLLLVGLVFLVIRFVVALRVTLTYRRYDRFLRGEDVKGFDSIRTGMAAALDAREFPQPETPFIYLLALPAVLVMILFSVAVAIAPNAERFMGMSTPLFYNSFGAAFLLFSISAAMGLAVGLCFRRQRAVVRGYLEALRMDEDTPFSADLEKYAHYQKQACDFYCFLWLLPVVAFLCVMQLFYVSSYARYATILGQYKFILPRVTEPLPYMLLSVVAIIFLAILFVLSLNNTVAYRRSDAANRKRHREAQERAEAEAAAIAAAATAEEAAAEEAAAAQETGLWGDYEMATEDSDETETPSTDTAAKPAAELDDFGFFLHTDEMAHPEPEVAPVYALDPLDPLERLRGIDAYDTAPVMATRRATNLHQLCDWFVSFARANGYEPEISSARALLAAMATSRVVFIRTRDEASAAFAATLSKFFGSNAPVGEVTAAWESPDDLLFHTTYGSKRASDCLCGLYRANYAGDAMCALTLTNAQQGRADLYLKDILAYAEKPERADRMPILNEPLSASKLSAKVTADECGVYMTMSENIWCLAVSSDAKKYAIPAAGYTTGSALAVCLRGKACEPVAEEGETAGLSASEFRRLVRGISERYFLPEEQWKKFDRIENFLQSRAGVRFDNRLMRRLENFSSAYLAVNNDANQILDAMLEAVFLPMIAGLDPDALGSIDGSAGICETMALSFGADNIPYCMQTLHELGFQA